MRNQLYVLPLNSTDGHAVKESIYTNILVYSYLHIKNAKLAYMIGCKNDFAIASHP